MFPHLTNVEGKIPSAKRGRWALIFRRKNASDIRVCTSQHGQQNRNFWDSMLLSIMVQFRRLFATAIVGMYVLLEGWDSFT